MRKNRDPKPTSFDLSTALPAEPAEESKGGASCRAKRQLPLCVAFVLCLLLVGAPALSQSDSKRKRKRAKRQATPKVEMPASVTTGDAAAAAAVTPSTATTISADQDRAEPDVPTILTMALVSDSSAAELKITSSSPLSRTVSRVEEGVLIVDLLGTQPAESLDHVDADGLVRRVEVEKVTGEAAATRLRITTTRSVQQITDMSGERLTMRLEPSGLARVEGSVEIAPEKPGDDARPRLATELMDLVAGIKRTKGPEPQGVQATELNEVEFASTASSSGVFLRGNGEFEFSCFQLREPDRFVVDLVGVTDMNGESQILLSTQHVTRVRVSQYKDEPPISRIVFELPRVGVARTLRTPDGLYVFFE